MKTTGIRRVLGSGLAMLASFIPLGEVLSRPHKGGAKHNDHRDNHDDRHAKDRHGHDQDGRHRGGHNEQDRDRPDRDHERGRDHDHHGRHERGHRDAARDDAAGGDNVQDGGAIMSPGDPLPSSPGHAQQRSDIAFVS